MGINGKKGALKKLTRELSFKKHQVYAPVNRNGDSQIVFINWDFFKPNREEVLSLCSHMPQVKFSGGWALISMPDIATSQDFAWSLGEKFDSLMVQNKIPFEILERTGKVDKRGSTFRVRV